MREEFRFNKRMTVMADRGSKFLPFNILGEAVIGFSKGGFSGGNNNTVCGNKKSRSLEETGFRYAMM